MHDYLFLMGNGRRPIGMQQGACKWGCIVVLVAWFGYHWLAMQCINGNGCLVADHCVCVCVCVRARARARAGGSEWVGWGQQNGSPLRNESSRCACTHKTCCIVTAGRLADKDETETRLVRAVLAACSLPWCEWSLNAVMTGPKHKAATSSSAAAVSGWNWMDSCSFS